MFVLAADLFSLLILNRTRLINDLNEVIALLQHRKKPLNLNTLVLYISENSTMELIIYGQGAVNPPTLFTQNIIISIN